MKISERIRSRALDYMHQSAPFPRDMAQYELNEVRAFMRLVLEYLDEVEGVGSDKVGVMWDAAPRHIFEAARGLLVVVESEPVGVPEECRPVSYGALAVPERGSSDGSDS